MDPPLSGLVTFWIENARGVARALGPLLNGGGA
jgi:hypothetical protein